MDQAVGGETPAVVEQPTGAPAELPNVPAAEPDDDVHDCSGEASSSELAPEFGHRWTLEQFSKYLPGEKASRGPLGSESCSEAQIRLFQLLMHPLLSACVSTVSSRVAVPLLPPTDQVPRLGERQIVANQRVERLFHRH